jgi:hypothetical protein
MLVLGLKFWKSAIFLNYIQRPIWDKVIMIKIKEQRRDLRFPNNDPVTMVVDNRFAYKGITKDISQSGAFIVTNGPFHWGQKLVIDLRNTRLKFEKKICSIVRIAKNGIGIRFEQPLGGHFSTALY